MRTQDILISLDEAEYNENSKKFTVDLSSYDLDDVKSVEVLECSLTFDNKPNYIYVNSDELYSRRKVPKNHTLVGSNLFLLNSKNVYSHPVTQSKDGAVSDDVITDMDDTVVLWLDPDDKTTTLDSAYEEKENAGDSLKYVVGKAPSVNHYFAGYNNTALQLMNFGNTKGITGGASWAYAVSSGSDDTRAITFFNTLCFLFRASPTSGEMSIIFKNDIYILFQWNGVFYFRDKNNANIATTLQLTPGKDYVVTIERYPEDKNSDGSHTDEVVTSSDGVRYDSHDFQLDWHVERLDNATVQTQTTVGCFPQRVAVNGTPHYLSDPQTHMNHAVGQLLLVNGNSKNGNGSRVTDCKNFIKSRYTNGAVLEEQITAYTYNIDETKTIEFKKSLQRISMLDLSFKNSNKELVKPVAGVVELRFYLS